MAGTKHLLLFFALLFSGILYGQQTKEQITLPVNYLLSLPEGYGSDTNKVWPLLIFLHGSGASGNDLDRVKMHGPPKLIEAGKKFQFIVVSPQADRQMGWQPELLEHFLGRLKSNYRVDKDRIYLTGLSMGGYGTWNWASRFPNNFAAIVPICGGGKTEEAVKLKNIPIWCFHGAKDNVVPLKQSTEMIDAVKTAGGNARLTVYPEAGHDSWTETYNNDSLYTWLLSHKRKRFNPIVIAEERLRTYAGNYQQGSNDTLKLALEKNQLVVKTGRMDLLLRPMALDRFFFEEGDHQFEIKFFRDQKGEIEKFISYGDKVIEFIKILK